MDEVIYDLWPLLSGQVNGHYRQWLQAWDKLEKKLETQVTRTKEARDFVQNW